MQILLVEDQDTLASQLTTRIERAGYKVDRVPTIEGAIEALDQGDYSLALLDRRLPDGDGISLIERIRAKRPAVRILILSALDATGDKVDGLDAGADDYLTKPFVFDEMMARIRAQLRGHGTLQEPPTELGALSFDPVRRSVMVGGRPVQFRRRELILLETLLSRANRVVSREALMYRLYGCDPMATDHALQSTVSRLRARLAEVEAGVEIRLARELGYFIRELAKKEEKA